MESASSEFVHLQAFPILPVRITIIQQLREKAVRRTFHNHPPVFCPI